MYGGSTTNLYPKDSAHGVNENRAPKKRQPNRRYPPSSKFLGAGIPSSKFLGLGAPSSKFLGLGAPTSKKIFGSKSSPVQISGSGGSLIQISGFGSSRFQISSNPRVFLDWRLFKIFGSGSSQKFFWKKKLPPPYIGQGNNNPK